MFVYQSQSARFGLPEAMVEKRLARVTTQWDWSSNYVVCKPAAYHAASYLYEYIRIHLSIWRFTHTCMYICNKGTRLSNWCAALIIVRLCFWFPKQFVLSNVNVNWCCPMISLVYNSPCIVGSCWFNGRSEPSLSPNIWTL